jgi:glycerophosphoryl diester phosphodiesterase
VVAPRLRAATLPLVVSSFRPAALAALRRRAPDVALGLLCGATIDAAVIAEARELGAASLHADHRGFRGATVARVIDAGLRPAAYTVNDADRAETLWRMGVPTVITDRPDTLLARAAALGLNDSAG